MQHALQALTDELRRLKSTGVKTVSVSDEAVAKLRRVVAGRVAVPGRSEKTDTAPVVVPVPAEAPEAREIAPAWTPPARGATPAAPAAPVVALPAAPVVALPDGDKAARWAALLAAVVNDPVCRASVRPGKKVVLGVGSLDARIMFVGEAPGAEEELQGEPFVGPAGQLLTRIHFINKFAESFRVTFCFDFNIHVSTSYNKFPAKHRLFFTSTEVRSIK